MTLPAHQVLGVPLNADPETLRKRYLQLVREFPPDRDPARFAEIRTAYDELRDPAKTLRQLLFARNAPRSLEEVVVEGKSKTGNRRFSTSLLLSLVDS